MISPVLASVLRSGRAEFNSRFAAARHLYPQLNGETFSRFLQTALDELAQATERVCADRVSDVVMAAYDAVLELAGQNLAGPGARQPLIEEAWRRILPKAATLVASAPARVIAAVCNGVHQLASTPGARPSQWIELMEALAPDCRDVEMLLGFGQLAGWRAGLAHFRQSALAVADGLPETLALVVIGAKANTRWPMEREKLLRNPWHDPAGDANNSAGLKAVARVGAFRGFGGLFVELPEVVAAGDDFLVRSGNDCWLLTADLFGATFHRAAEGEFEAARRERRETLQISGERVILDGQKFEFPELGLLTSAAANDTTLALTGRLTHSVALAALP